MIKVNSKFESRFVLDNLYITDSQLKIVSDNIEEIDTTLSFEFDDKIKYLSDNNATIKLQGKVKNANNSFWATATINAAFTFAFGNEISEDVKQDLFERNSLSILFPYLRSYFSLLTCSPGIPPVVLPAININAYLDSKKDEA